MRGHQRRHHPRIFRNNFPDHRPGRPAGEARGLALRLSLRIARDPALNPIDSAPVGPSLGRDNIDKGVTALSWAWPGCFLFMALYYKTFGGLADPSLATSVLRAALHGRSCPRSCRSPGAPAPPPFGMAVTQRADLRRILERSAGRVAASGDPAGFEKAFSPIAGFHITTRIAGVVCGFRSGPIRRASPRAHPRQRHLDVHFAHGSRGAPPPHLRRAGARSRACPI